MATREQSEASFHAARDAVMRRWDRLTLEQQAVFRRSLQLAADLHGASRFDESQQASDLAAVNLSMVSGSRSGSRAGGGGPSRAGVSFADVFSFLPESFSSVFGNVSPTATASSPLASWGIAVNTDMRRGYDARVIAMRFSEAAAKGDVQKGVSLLADPKVVSSLGAERNRQFTIDLSALSSRSMANVEARKRWEQWIRDRDQRHLDDARYSSGSWPEMDKVIAENDDIATAAQLIVGEIARRVPDLGSAKVGTGATLGPGQTFTASSVGVNGTATMATPVYKRPWFWASVGGGVVVLSGVAYALAKR